MKRFLLIITLSFTALLAGNCISDIIEVIEPVDDPEGGEVTTLTDPALTWSAASYEATIGASNSFPTLTNTYSVSVNYASSDASVATIASNGSITLLASGTATITASSAETEAYYAGSASYTLTVSRAAAPAGID